MTSIVVVPLTSLARNIDNACSKVSAAEYFFSFYGGAAYNIRSLRSAPPQFGRVIVTTPDQLLHNKCLSNVLKEGVGTVFIDEADTALLHSTFRASYALLPNWISFQNKNQETPLMLRFITATIGVRRLQKLVLYYKLNRDQIKVHRHVCQPHSDACHKLVERHCSPAWSNRAPKTARDEHQYRVSTIFAACRAAFLSGFSSCVYVNYKSDADHLSRDLKRLCIAANSELRTLEIHKHYTGMDQAELRATEKLLTSDEEDANPVVVVATLGLGVGLDFKRVAFVAHYTCPTSVSRISQEWGRAGRGPNVPIMCLTFYSRDEILSMRKVVLTESPVAGRDQPMPQVRDLVSRGLSLLRSILESRVKGFDHIRIRSNEATALGSWAALWLKTPALSSLSFPEKWDAVQGLSANTMTFCAELPWFSFHFSKVTARITVTKRELHKSFKQTRILFEARSGQTLRPQYIMHVTRLAEQYLKALFDEEVNKKSSKCIYLRPDVITLARRIRPVAPGSWLDPTSCSSAESYLDCWFRVSHVSIKDEAKSRNRFGLEGTVCVPRFPAWIKQTDRLPPAAIWKILPNQTENFLREHLHLLLTDLQELDEFLFSPAPLCTQQKLAKAHDLETAVVGDGMDDFRCLCSSCNPLLRVQECIRKVFTRAL